MRVNRGFRIGVVIATLIALFAIAAPGQSAGIAGVAMSEDGTFVPGVRVFYNNIPDYVIDSRGRMRITGVLIGSSVLADSQGRFRIEGIPPGSYYVCAEAVRLNQLGSCEWYGFNAPVRVGSGAAASVTLTMREAAVVHFDVRDSNGRIAAAGNHSFGLGVIADDGYYKAARLLESTANSQRWAVAVPRGLALSLIVAGKLDVRDQHGASVTRDRRSLRFPPLGRAEITQTLDIP